MLRSALCALVVLTVLAVPAGAGAAAWSPAVSVPVAGLGGFEPQVAIAADGSELLLWVDANGVESAARAPGAPAFGPAQTVAPAPAPGGALSRLEVAQVPGGETIALWSRATAGAPADQIEWSARPPGGTFGAVHQVPATGLPADHRTIELSAGAAANGDVVLAWSAEGTQADGRYGFRVFGSVRPAGGEFRLPTPLGALGGLSPDVAVGPDGGAVAAWLEGGGTRPGAVREARRPSGGGFGPAQTLERKSEAGLAQPFVATGVGGETVAVWYRRDGRSKRLHFAVRRPADERFARIGDLGRAPTRRYALGDSRAGDVAAVWDDRQDDRPVLRVRRRVPGHGFGAPVSLTHASAGTRTIQAAITDAGILLTAWQRTTGTDAYDLWAAGQARSGRRTELVRLQPPAPFFAFALAAGPAGRGLVAWTAGAAGLLVSSRG